MAFRYAIVMASLMVLTSACHETSNQSESGSSTYIRWGCDLCPEDAELVYSGFMGGAKYTPSGGAANHLCLPFSPVYPTQQPASSYGYGEIFSAEYETSNEIRKRDLDGVCAVCRINRPTNIMIPVTTQCPDNWNTEYIGFLMSGKPDPNRVSTQYVCVDQYMEGRTGTGDVNSNQGVLYYTQTKCGGTELPCGQNYRTAIAGCVLCSK